VRTGDPVGHKLAFFFLANSFGFHCAVLTFPAFSTHILELFSTLSFILVEYSGQTVIRMVYGQDIMGALLTACLEQFVDSTPSVNARVT
jgi:hypothetical protein